MTKQHDSRRDFVKKAAYLAPAIVTLAAAPAFAKAGSENPENPKHPELPNLPDQAVGPGRAVGRAP